MASGCERLTGTQPRPWVRGAAGTSPEAARGVGVARERAIAVTRGPLNRPGVGGEFWPWKRGRSYADGEERWEADNEAYSAEERAAAVRMVRALQAETG